MPTLDPNRFNRAEGTATRAGRAYIALAVLHYTRETEQAAMALAERAADNFDHKGRWCAWHGLAMAHGRVDTCACSFCTRAH